MADSVRDIEVLFSGIEDEILEDLGYREYRVFVNNVELNPKPEIVQKPLASFSDGTIKRFIDSLGGQGNPITYYKLFISRTISEETIRVFGYWLLARGTYNATCLPVEFKVTDSRYEVLLGVIKQSEQPEPPFDPLG
jgi:hypothetical protein